MHRRSDSDTLRAKIQTLLQSSHISFNGRHFETAVSLQSIRWYLGYSLSYRDIEEIMKERSFDVTTVLSDVGLFTKGCNWRQPFNQKNRRV